MNADVTTAALPWTQRYTGAMMNTFGTPVLEFVSGHGATLVDEAGRTYLDLLGGIAVNVVGQCHPAVVQAIADQAATLGHVSNFFATPAQIDLAEALLRIVEPGGAPEGSRVFLANSGTEANECALKIAKAHANTCSPAKTRIIALDHAFHGRTIGALSLTWKEQYRLPFAPLVEGVEFIPANDVAALDAAMGEDVAAVFVEPIQGEAGVYPLSSDYLRAVRDACRRAGALMIVDEVQTGMGRTGAWMAHCESGIVPDVVTLAKGLGGGVPIGACIALGSAGSVLGPGMHGTTFGGNPICAAAANAVISIIGADGFLDEVVAKGERWRSALESVPGVAQVRGRGLLIGIDFEADVAAQVVELGRHRGFILNATGPRTLRLAPPLIISDDEAASFTAALGEFITQATTKIERTRA